MNMATALSARAATRAASGADAAPARIATAMEWVHMPRNCQAVDRRIGQREAAAAVLLLEIGGQASGRRGQGRPRRRPAATGGELLGGADHHADQRDVLGLR